MCVPLKKVRKECEFIMDKNSNDFQAGFSPYNNPQNSMDMNDMYKDPMFNPIMQYEQAYSYYKYLCIQMDYKIKCKEYENLCNNSNRAVVTEK